MTVDRERVLALMLVCIATAAGLTACGGGGPEESTTPTSTKGSSSGGGSARFRVKGGDNSIQEFGAQAGPLQLRQAAAALHGYLRARAHREWSAACSHLAGSARAGLLELEIGKGCDATLAMLAGATRSAPLAEAAIAEIGALRVKGRQGFLLYRGGDGLGYAIAVEHERGSWRVASLTALPLS